jgi:hypothetical protein
LNSRARIQRTVSTGLRQPTVEFAAEHRLPVIYPFREDVLAGGLVSSGTSRQTSIGRPRISALGVL